MAAATVVTQSDVRHIQSAQDSFYETTPTLAFDTSSAVTYFLQKQSGSQLIGAQATWCNVAPLPGTASDLLVPARGAITSNTVTIARTGGVTESGLTTFNLELKYR